MILWKFCIQYASKFGKHSFHSSPKEGQSQRILNYHTTAFISHASKFMLKILQDRLQHCIKWELPDGQAGFRKGRTRNQIANIRWIIEKEREVQKNIYFCFIDHAKALDCVQFSSVTQSCPTLCNPMNCRTPGLPVHHQLLEFTQTFVHWVGDAIQPSHPL